MVNMNAQTEFETMAVAESDFPLEPLEDILFIEQETEDKSAGGIVLLGNDRKLPGGRVVAAGPGRVYTAYMDASGHNQYAYFVPNRIKAGDWVTFGKYTTGEPLELNGKRYIVARAGDIAAISRSGEPVPLKLANVG